MFTSDLYSFLIGNHVTKLDDIAFLKPSALPVPDTIAEGFELLVVIGLTFDSYVISKANIHYAPDVPPIKKWVISSNYWKSRYIST
jgi:hypothetical protein